MSEGAIEAAARDVIERLSKPMGIKPDKKLYEFLDGKICSEYKVEQNTELCDIRLREELNKRRGKDPAGFLRWFRTMMEEYKLYSSYAPPYSSSEMKELTQEEIRWRKARIERGEGKHTQTIYS